MQVHWHEGLFLLPHHLQRIQRSLNESASAERRLSWAYPYGVIDARLSNDDLENMRLRFSARANCVNPGQTVDPRAKILYRISEAEVPDENTGENVKTVLQRRVNARLLLDNEDRSDLEVIPLLRVTRAAGEEVGLPRRDPEFVGPCFILNGSATLRELVRDLSSQVLGSRQELVLQITRGGFSIDTMRGIQFEQVMRLRTLNRFGARLEALVETPNLAPLDF